VLLKVNEHEHAVMRLGEVIDGPLDGWPHIDQLEEVSEAKTHRLDMTPHGRQRIQISILALDHPVPTAECAEEGVATDRKEPGSRVVLWPIRTPAAVRAEKRLLNKVVSISPIACHGQREPGHRVQMWKCESLEFLDACARQCRISHWFSQLVVRNLESDALG
jgi:hypothetical protein